MTTTPITPAGGTPVQRTSTEKPKAPQASSTQTFSTASSDKVETGNQSLSFGSLRPLINTQLTNQTAIATAQQTGQQLSQQKLAVVNNRPQVVSNLVETHSKAQG